VLCHDGVVLGADSRSTSGALVADAEKRKLRQLSLGMMAAGAGTSADCERITRHVSHLLALSRIDRELTIPTLISSFSSSSSHVILQDSTGYALKLFRSALRGESKELSSRRKPEAVFILAAAETVSDIGIYIQYI
jgi:20S proteasome alpha/beta subunit